MTKELIIIVLVLALIYLYYQKQQTNFLTGTSDSGDELTQVKQTNNTLVSFLKENLNSNSLEELKTKLGKKSLDEILEERQSLAETLSKVEEQNEDYETEVDTLTRTKNSLEADLLAQSNAFQSRLKEKDREIKKFREDLASEKQQNTDKSDLTQEVERLKNTSKNERRQAQKFQEKLESELNSERQQHKGSLERISKLTEQITGLEQQVQRTKSPLPGEFPQENLTQEHQEQLRKIYALFDLRAKGMKEIDFNQLMSMLQGVKKQVDKK
jgi:chromosome segregation ATPase